ncbi:MAG: alkaline shock response membrane anchor protein AmaP [Actinomycetota bacterium]|nr:alkaline shock response membrane anchor protein AmaP [Actinomycetota bacterium]
MRVANRVLAAVLALALFVGGLLIAVEIVVAGFDRRPWVVPHDDWYTSARLRSWESAPPRWIFIGLAAAGLTLLISQLARRRATTLALAPGSVPADLGRRSLEKSLVRAASRVDGVSAAKAKIKNDKADVVASSNRRQTDDLGPAVTEALDRRMGALGLARPPAVRVKVNGRSSR